MRALRIPLILVGLCLAAAPRLDAPVTCPGNPCGTAIILTRAEPGSLFPPAIEYSSDAAVIDLMYLRLADLGASVNTLGDTGFVPRIAASWRREGPLALTFQIDPRAHWQDGVPVSAQDVAFTFDIYRDTVVNASARAQIASIATVTATDSRTVAFRFRRAYPEQLYDATQHMRILPRHLMDSVPRGRLITHPLSSAPIGNGPYRFVSWRRGESFEMAADSTFFLGRPGIAWLIWRRDMDVSSTAAKLVAGEGDLMEHLGAPEIIERVRAGRDVRVVEYLSTSYMYLDFNLRDPGDLSRPHPLFADRDLRRALSQAVDRPTLVRRAYDRYAEVAVGPISRLLPAGRDTTLPRLAYDPTAAARALAGLGWNDSDGDGIRDRQGRKLAFDVIYPTSSVPRTRAAEVLREQLLKVGVEARPTPLDFGKMGDLTQSRTFDAALMGWNDDPTPSGIRQNWTTAGIGGSNYGAYSNPEFDRLVDQAIGEFDPARARERWRAAYTVIIQDAPAIWLATPTNVAAVHRRFENVSLQPQEWTATLWQWRVTPGQTIPRDLVPAPSGPR